MSRDRAVPELQPVSWERMIRAVEKVRERLLKATAALEAARVPYAVTGGNAVAAWVSRVDEGAVRNTPDVDLLVRRADFGRVTAALESTGFVRRPSGDAVTFLEHEGAPRRNAVRVRFAGEAVEPGDALPAPAVAEAETLNGVRVLRLVALARMELTAFRTVNQVHLRDMIGVGLIDGSWADRFPAPLGERLRTLLEDPDG